MIANQIKTDLQLDTPHDIDNEMKDLPDNFIFFTYPQAEGRNVFVQGVLFHEVGHAIDWNRSISKTLFNAINWSGGDSALPKVFESWVREITADLVATRLVGPCILFSSRSASLTTGALHNDSRSHPSSRFRFLWMLEHLEKLGYMNESLNLRTFKILRRWYADLKRSGPEHPTSPEFETVRTVLSDPNVKNALHSNIQQTFPDAAYTAKRFIASVPRIVANFKDLLPHCGEGTDPADHIASVFNALWESSFLDPLQDRCEAELAADREILCGLVLESIEANLIQGIWRA